MPETHKDDWKNGGHKAACATFREECMADADDLLMLMAGGGRGIVVHFERFDTEPVYTYAVERGLNGGVGLNEMFLKLLKRDADEGHAAWAREGAGVSVSYLSS